MASVEMDSIGEQLDIKDYNTIPRESKLQDGDRKKVEVATEPLTNGAMVGPLKLFQYATPLDRLLMGLGAICAAANGAAFPVLVVIFAKVIEYFVDFDKLDRLLSHVGDFLLARNLSRSDVIKDPTILNQRGCDDLSLFYGGNLTCPVFLDEGVFDRISYHAVHICILGCVVMVSGYGQIVFWVVTSERQARRIRHECLSSILRQSVGWFDVHNTSELNSRLTNDIAKIQEGLGHKLSTLVQWLTTTVTCLVIGVAYGWKLALVILSMCPIIFLVTGAMNKLATAMTSKELEEYAKAGAIANEVLGAIRTVAAFGGEEKEAVRYYQNLSSAKKYGIKKGITHGLALGSFWMIIFLCNALGFWYGGKLHRHERDDYPAATVITVFISIIFGAYAFGNTAPSLQTYAEARGAASAVYDLIGVKSEIDSSSKEGLRLKAVKGSICFSNIYFSYPTRPDVQVLKGVSLEVQPGQTVAVVGASGSGKSTLIQLLMRFYDASLGKITLDGYDIKTMNVQWLRHSMGVVSQEPVLFATTIAENIRYGNEDATMEDIVRAAKSANAYDFIVKFPDQFNTLVGEGGAQMSGGQKQRIAIARALVRNPKILLLDEATSALDTESEAVVQDALNKARQGRTTFVVAHRLSTIRNADVICGIQDGRLVETGSHDELMTRKGVYYQLVMNQALSSEEEKDTADTKSEMKSYTEDTSINENPIKDNDIELLEKDPTEKKNAVFTRLLRMNKPEWSYILLGCIGSVINGCVLPAFAIIFSGLMYVFSKDNDDQKKEFERYAFILIGVGLVSLVTYFLQSSMFGISGESLTLRVRDQSFKAMLRQDISWFDNPSHNVGSMTSMLAVDASQLQGVTGVKLGASLMSASVVVAAFTIGFLYGWQMTVILLGFVPFIVIGDVIKIKMFAGQANDIEKALESSGKIIAESIGNIRTVASLSLEENFFNKYKDRLDGPYKKTLRESHLAGAGFGFSQASVYFFYATAFVFGAYMIEEDEMDARDVFRVFCAVVFGALGLGDASAFAPDFGKAKASANRVLQMIDSKSSTYYTQKCEDTLPEDFQADIEFKEVEFSYPSRPSVKVLQGLDATFGQGLTVALVGSSGGGKSTIVGILERFYDSTTGSVSIANRDIKTLSLSWLRQQMALVSQEPVLFDKTIAENIAYGDNTRNVSMDEIIHAARMANVHEFISSLPNAYSTQIGSKGSQLSGGQRQRIAIARALIRDPKILLLDEATASLDTESEKIVHEALDRARVGRTCVIIAHRLSTVQNADKICVLRQGRIVEQGTHDQLMALKGSYYGMVGKSSVSNQSRNEG